MAAPRLRCVGVVVVDHGGEFGTMRRPCGNTPEPRSAFCADHEPEDECELCGKPGCEPNFHFLGG